MSIDEAWRWLEAELEGRPVPPLLALIGLGDGRLLDALEQRAPATRVLALEPDPGKARDFLVTRSWDRWRTTGRLVYLADPDYVGADDAWRMFPASGDAPPVLLHPDLTLGAGVARASQVLKNILFGVEANAEARRRFAPRYLVNSLFNLPAIAAGRDVRALADAYRGIPAVIVAAGPSLDTAIDDLRDAHDRALIIATDTALRPLLLGGVAPPLVVGLDPSAVNARHFLSLPECRDTWLVGESALDRSAAAAFEDRSFWFRVARHHPWPWFNELGIDVGQVDVWGSVLTAAFQVACLAGCDPIVAVGADLSFTQGRPYARGTTYEFDWAYEAALGTAVEDTWRAQTARARQQSSPDLRGVATMTTASMISFRDWLVARARRSGRRVINATGAGILFGEGVEQQTLADALSRSFTITSVGTVASTSPRTRPSALTTRVRSVRETLAGGSVSAPIGPWTAFAGGGFDAVAVGTALDAAAHALEAQRGGPAATAVIPWPQLVQAPASRLLLTHLAETTTHVRATLKGDLSTARVPVAARVADLVQAFSLLSRIHAAALHEPDLAAPIPAEYAGRELIGPWCLWREPVRWAVHVFEALLASSWPSRVPDEAENPFLARPMEVREAPSGSPSALRRPERPNTTHACALLGLEWIACWCELDQSATSEAKRLLHVWGWFESLLRPAAYDQERDTTAVLVLTVEDGDGSDALELPVPVDEREVARVFTGVRQSDDAPWEVVRVEVSGVCASLAVRGGRERAARP